MHLISFFFKLISLCKVGIFFLALFICYLNLENDFPWCSFFFLFKVFYGTKHSPMEFLNIYIKIS